jgi:hypothetical protein
VSPLSRFVKDKDEDNNMNFEKERENITSETTIDLELLNLQFLNLFTKMYYPSEKKKIHK